MVHAGVVFKEFTVNPAQVAAHDSNDETVTVAGLRPGHPVIMWAPSLEDKLVLTNAHCSAKDTLKFRLANEHTAAVDPASQTMYVVQL
jgi:hypothetical protein